MKKLLAILSIIYSASFIALNAQIISTFAGNGVAGYSGDGGTATAAELDTPEDVAIDASGNIYIADQWYHRIRMVNTSGIITTVAGNGYFAGGYSGDGGPATDAELNGPNGVAVDPYGNLFIADLGNQRIREVSGGFISTVAGNGIAGYSGDGGPATTAELNSPHKVAVDAADNIYIADAGNLRLRIVRGGNISTFAGDGIGGFSGDGGQATAAEIAGPGFVTLDHLGNVYIGGTNIRKVNSLGIISTIAGIGYGGYDGDGGPATAAELNYPDAMAIDNTGNLLIADADNDRIRIVSTDNLIFTLAGNGFGSPWNGGYSGDGGPSRIAELNWPRGVTVDLSGNAYIAEFSNNRIRKVTLSFNILTAITANVSCNGDNNGAASVMALGGTPPYTYSWSPTGATTDTVSGLSAGIYTITATDSTSLTTSATITITQPPVLMVTATVLSNISCNGGRYGIDSVFVSGGTSPYTYSWNNGQTNATATGLSSGTYIVNVTDSGGCTGSASVTITQPPALGDVMKESCATCCNCKGVAIDSIYGGTMPYTFSWSNGGTTDTLTGLAGGSYTCMVTDAHGCTKTDTVFVTFGPPVSGSQTNVFCYGGNTGSASISVSGNYSYSWSPGGATTSSVSGLSAGSYTATVTNVDTLGCSGSLAFTISQPDSLYGFLSVGGVYNTLNFCADSFCYDVGVQVFGGTPPYTFTDFSPPLGNYCASVQFNTATLIDANGCTYNLPSNDIAVYIGLSVRAQINGNVGCNGGDNGSATINTHTGNWYGLGIPLTYSWSPGGGTNQTESNLSAGTYTVTVSGGPGPCTVTAVIAITQPPLLSLSSDSVNATSGNCDGSATAVVSGGVSPYTYSWNTAGQTTATISGQCAGDYCCNVTDANGCQNSVCVTVATTTGTSGVKGESEQVKVFPNPNNGVFTVTFSHAELVSASQPIARVINVLGQQVYFATLNQVQGDNFIDISSQPDGIYLIRIENEDGSLIAQKKIVKM